MTPIVISEESRFKTRVARFVRDGDDGLWLLESETHNLITTSGKGIILDRLLPGNIIVPPSHIGIGNGASAAAVTDTQLQGGSVLLQAFDTGSTGQFPAPSRSGLTNSYYVTYGTAVANFTHNELAVFLGGTNGTSTMLNRAIVSAYTKTSANSVAYLYQLTQA